MVRFERAQQMLRRSAPFLLIAQVAVDFVAMAGCMPTELLAGDVPSVQDSAGGAGASSRYERNHHGNDNNRLAVPHLS
ncbi:hypothetical protein ACWD1Z_26080 [Streptomyces sp. NPDC002784]